MHDLDRWKVMRAGFDLFRCSESELVIKKRTAADRSWKIIRRCTTKKEVKELHSNLLKNPKSIQD